MKVESKSLLMRRETKTERTAWTEHFSGEVVAPSKYGNHRTGKYASKHEAEVAGKLATLAASGAITGLEEQYRIVLVPGKVMGTGKDKRKLRPIVYVADFRWFEDGREVIADAKGFQTAVYRLKKRMAALLKDTEIIEL